MPPIFLSPTFENSNVITKWVWKVRIVKSKASKKVPFWGLSFMVAQKKPFYNHCYAFSFLDIPKMGTQKVYPFST